MKKIDSLRPDGGAQEGTFGGHMRTRTRYLPGLDVVLLTAMLPVVCYHFTIDSARAG